METLINTEAIKLTGYTAPTTVGADPVTADDTFVSAMQKIVANEDGDNIIHFSYPSGPYAVGDYSYEGDVISGILVSYDKTFYPDSAEPYTVEEVVDGWALMQNAEGKYIIFFEGVVNDIWSDDEHDSVIVGHEAAMPFSRLKTLTKAELQSALNNRQYFGKTIYSLNDFATVDKVEQVVATSGIAKLTNNYVDYSSFVNGVYYLSPGTVSWFYDGSGGTFDFTIPKTGYGIMDKDYIRIHSISGTKVYRWGWSDESWNMFCEEVTEDIY